jgi:hypothetical protein
MKPIYTIGDSHCIHSWNKIPGVTILSRGPMTMFSLGNGDFDMVGEILDGSIAVFCWGEIDCRCHVHRHPPYQSCIDMLVYNYRQRILKSLENRNVIPFVLLIAPPVYRQDSGENLSFPFLGTDDERKLYVNYMNSKLRDLSKDGIMSFDVYDKFCDSNGFLNRDMSDSHVHMTDERPFIEFIQERMVNL